MCKFQKIKANNKEKGFIFVSVYNFGLKKKLRSPFYKAEIYKILFEINNLEQSVLISIANITFSFHFYKTLNV